MAIDDRNGDGPSPAPRKTAPRSRARPTDLAAYRTWADADQTLADADQTASDADQTAAESDDTGAARDQLASDRDQASADRDHDADASRTADEEVAYDTSRDEREITTIERLGTHQQRAATAADRDVSATDRDRSATDRDRIAEARDKAGKDRDARAIELAAGTTDALPLEEQLALVQAQAAADRARAAADRERAALDRRNAARDRARLQAELRSAHLDELTGVYRREMGRLALANEIARARRSDGRFVVAFIDVDRLKAVNDRDGHAAGDRVLQTVVHEIRARLRSFDPIIRFGGDEFVCGIGGTDVEEAWRRFATIGEAIEADAGVGISVGLAGLIEGDDPDQLIERADADMLQVKATHHMVN